MKRTRIGAIFWIFCLQYFVAEAVSIRGWPGYYSLSENYISDLGAIGCGAYERNLTSAAQTLCSPLHAVINTSFIIQGIFIICGTALLWSSTPKGMLWKTALSLVGASGLGVFIVGLAPEDELSRLHYFGAVENFVCCNAGMVAMGIAMLSSSMRMAGSIAFVSGGVGLLGIVFLAMGIDLGLGVGGMERLVAYPFPLWLAGMGVLLLRNRAWRSAEAQ
jgi:hypothetical membrane protein